MNSFNDPIPSPRRRRLLAAGIGMAATVLVQPALATPEEMAAAIRAFTGGAAPVKGKMVFEVPVLVDNGNAVPVSVSVESPMSEADHVVAIAIFNERNPQPEVAVFNLGPRAGRAAVTTRIRLADTQTLTAVAKLSNGRFIAESANVIVTLAACLEGEG